MKGEYLGDDQLLLVVEHYIVCQLAFDLFIELFMHTGYHRIAVGIIALHNAFDAEGFRCVYGDYLIHVVKRFGLKHQCGLFDDIGSVLLLGPGCRIADGGGVNEGIKNGQFFLIGKYDIGDVFAVEGTVGEVGGVSEMPAYLGSKERVAHHDIFRCFIGIIDRDAENGKYFCYGGFSGADAAGDSDNTHKGKIIKKEKA